MLTDLLDMGFRQTWSTWTHLIGAVLAVPATVDLLRRCRGGWARRLGLLIYGLTMVALFGASALYHGSPLREDELFLRLDHCAIYLLIAGTNLPIHQTLAPDRRGLWLNLSMWTLAGTGIAIRAGGVEIPYSVAVGLYIALGFFGALGFPMVLTRLPAQRLGLMILGGWFYIAGAVMDACRWPPLIPGVWGGHESFHVFVLCGAACFYLFIRREVAPFSDDDAESSTVGDTARAQLTELVSQLPELPRLGEQLQGSQPDESAAA